MSGLEPLAALGLACNVLQLVEVGHDTIGLIKAIYRGASPDAELNQRAAVLGSISDDVKTYRRPKKYARHEHQLFAAAETCSTAARDLREEVKFLVGNAKQGSLASALKVVAKTNWRKRRLERLKESLDNAERLMQTGLLTRIWSSTSTAELDLKGVKGDLRTFIEQHGQGIEGVKELVSKENNDIKNHVSSVSAETNTVLGSVDQRLESLVLESGSKVTQEKRDRLLQSFKYAGFNERRNHVSEAYDKTAKWIFAGDDNDTDVTEVPVTESDDTNSGRSETDETAKAAVHHLSDMKWDSFSNWLRSTDTFYWISGKPGSGKSTLVKFVLDHQDTRNLLEVWNPGTLVISHFFWRPGTSLQQNIKGLLCSLIYQLLQHSAKAVSSVLSSMPDSNFKDANTDWSEVELAKLCLQITSTYERPLCFFIDGLDEVDPRDGVVSLLRFIEKLSQSANTKICLSSRPEPLLQNRLSMYPRLRLQDLNRGDLELYARDHVKFPDDYIAEPHDDHYEDPIISLVDTAEGVFLWLVLAIRSINKGVEYGDTTATFQQRIDKLPRDLISLYKDMWNRACEDDPPAYRQTAALYFKVLLAHHDRGSGFGCFFQKLQLLILMLATTPTADQILQAGDNIPSLPPEDIMVQRCKEVEKKVDVYCFGLIEIDQTESGQASAVGMFGNNYDALMPYTGASKLLRFIHRTAHDFLTDTMEGREILSFDTSSKPSLDARIIKAYLAESQLFLHADSTSGWERDSGSGASFAGPLLCIIRTSRLASGDTDDFLENDWYELVRYCEVLCKAGKLFDGSRTHARLCTGDGFLKAVANTCGDERIRYAIKHQNMSEDLKSEVLLNSCNLFVNGFGGLMHRDRFVEGSIRTLLTEGADPNYKGVLFSPEFWHWPFAALKTPFTGYLESTLIQVKEARLVSAELLTILETLQLYISQKACLDDLVTFFFDLPYRPPKEPPRAFYPFQLVQLNYCHVFSFPRRNAESILFASFPAYRILETLLYTIRRDCSPPDEGTKFEDLLVFLEDQCREWHTGSRETPRAFGRVSRDENSPEKPLLLETTREQQECIGVELLDKLRNLQSLPNGARHRMGKQSDGESEDSILSLCAQATWSSKASGDDAIWARFEELGIYTRVDGLCELRSTEEWVEGRLSWDAAGGAA